LTTLDKKIKPDVVLIEYQMIQNDISRSISHQIAYHYINVDIDIIEKFVHTNQTTNNDTNQTTNNDTNPTIQTNQTTNNDTTVYMVGPSLKNTCAFSKAGMHSNFIEKYTNYTANKKHTTFNFMYYLKRYDVSLYAKIIDSGIYKDDIADAFMMIYSWLIQKKLIDNE
jgi:hypothetical protein